MDGMNPVPSPAVYRIFSPIFVLCGINWNGTENGTGYIGTGTENGWVFFHPYCRFPVFDRDISIFILYVHRNKRGGCWAQLSRERAVSQTCFCAVWLHAEHNVTRNSYMYVFKKKSQVHVCIYVYVTQKHLSNVSFFLCAMRKSCLP